MYFFAIRRAESLQVLILSPLNYINKIKCAVQYQSIKVNSLSQVNIPIA